MGILLSVFQFRPSENISPLIYNIIMQLINYSNSILSIIPAAIALALAIATRRVLLSLGVGIIVGSFLLVGGNPLDALVT